MQTAPTPQTETDKARAAFAERLSGFPLIAPRTPREEVDQRTTTRRAAFKADPRRFTGEPLTGFGALQ